jgi:hypothetical protein
MESQISDDLIAAVAWANFKQTTGTNSRNAHLFIEEREMAFILYLFGVFQEERTVSIIGAKPTDLRRLTDLAIELSPLSDPDRDRPLSPYERELLNVSNKMLRLSNRLQTSSPNSN